MVVDTDCAMRYAFHQCPGTAKLDAPIDFRDHDVHIWSRQIDPGTGDVAHLQSVLSDEEHQRASRFRFDKHRNRYIYTRGTLRLILSSIIDAPPDAFQFEYSDHGKPSLTAPHLANQVAFNVSHTDGAVIVAVCRGRQIGVDVEKVRSDFATDEIAERFFSHAEQIALRKLPLSERREAFFRCWTRKEAYIKARGEGLSHPLHQFDVSLGADASLLGTRPDPLEATRWSLRDVPIAAGYVAAVAVESEHSQPA